MVRTLQYLRGIAAMLVVYYHAVLQVRSAFADAPRPLPMFGRCGVDLFFVISGFVMWRSTAYRDMGVGAFYRRRIVRIVPLYWAVTLAACVIALAIPDLLRSTKFELPHAIASFLFFPWPNPGLAVGGPEKISPIVIPGWTLNYEMFFYVLFGLSLLVREAWRPYAIAALIGTFLIAGAMLGGANLALHFYGSTLLLEFLAGVVIAAYLTCPGRSIGHAIPVFLLVVLFPLLFWLDWIGLGGSRALQLGVPAALIIWCAVTLDQPSARGSPWLEELGDASYSIYLTHVFVIAALRVIAKIAGVTMHETLSVMIFVLCALAASAVGGVIIYRRVERPLTDAAGRMLLGRKPRLRLTAAESTGFP